MAPFEAMYGRKCRIPIYWFEVGECQLLKLEIIQETLDEIELIRERLRSAQSQQKSYVNNRRCDLEFAEGDSVFLKVSSAKGAIRFGKRMKQAPRFIGPFEILDRIGPSGYRVALPPTLSRVHDVFHVSSLRRYVPDLAHLLEYDPIKIQEDLTYEEHQVKILDRNEQVLCSKILLVKVL